MLKGKNRKIEIPFDTLRMNIIDRKIEKRTGRPSKNGPAFLVKKIYIFQYFSNIYYLKIEVYFSQLS
ncbi:hypothetical protein C0966_08985 [Bacillus methanolicus]|nr:hypothetical protein [Bacillus methanolicus]